ncbi:hypothetical protein [uncultured Gammaproteobacteria bacterium]|nr:hypothetical protein [uncultured Gammaproteobacteria bacterium]CAC9957938.1 hypothetical protein [uncultured Gammaproteobacteria bacterium]
MNNHQKSTFYQLQLGNFFKPSLSLVKTEFFLTNLTKLNSANHSYLCRDFFK